MHFAQSGVVYSI